MLLKAILAFGFAAAMTGTGPFAGPAGSRWQLVRAELDAARPRERLAAQAHVLFHSGAAGDGVARRPDAVTR